MKIGAEMNEQPTRPSWAWSVAIATLVTAASMWGLLSESAYEEETVNWATQARGQDVGNLLAVVTLLLSAYWHRRGSHRAGLVWLGTLLYLVYAYVVYAMAVHFNQLFLVYVAALGVSSYAVMFSLARLRTMDEAYPAPDARALAGYTSIVIGVLFGGLWLGELVPATLTDGVPTSVSEAGLWVNPIHVIDLALLLPAMVIVGVLTLRGRTAGEFFVAPLLVFSVLMGSSIVAAMTLMLAEGFENTLPPLVMVTTIVLASAVAAWRYLGRYGTPRLTPESEPPSGRLPRPSGHA
jgi:hypothetical protein